MLVLEPTFLFRQKVTIGLFSPLRSYFVQKINNNDLSSIFHQAWSYFINNDDIMACVPMTIILYKKNLDGFALPY